MPGGRFVAQAHLDVLIQGLLQLFRQLGVAFRSGRVGADRNAHSIHVAGHLRRAIDPVGQLALRFGRRMIVEFLRRFVQPLDPCPTHRLGHRQQKRRRGFFRGAGRSDPKVARRELLPSRRLREKGRG